MKIIDDYAANAYNAADAYVAAASTRTAAWAAAWAAASTETRWLEYP